MWAAAVALLLLAGAQDGPTHEGRALDEECSPQPGARAAPSWADAPSLTNAPPKRPAPPAHRPHWDDHDDVAWVVAEGTFSICDAMATPLLLVPGVGSLAFSAVSWSCVAPAVLGVEWVETYHGHRDLFFWESATAVLAAKLIRDVMRFPAVVSFTTTSLSAVVLGLLAAGSGGLGLLPFDIPPAYQPIALTGLLTSQAVLLTVVDAARELLAYWAFRASLSVLSDVEDTQEARRDLEEESWLPPRLDVGSRFWLLATVTAGSRPAFSGWHVIPVAGRLVWAYDASETLRARLVQVKRDSLDEDDSGLIAASVAIYLLYSVDAAFAILTDVVTVISALLFLSGTVLFLAAGDRLAAGGGYAQAVALLGATGVALASSTYVFLLATEAKRFIAPWLIPLLVGPLPPGFFDDEGETPSSAPGQ